jgi:hypothetical protein
LFFEKSEKKNSAWFFAHAFHWVMPK